MEAKEKAKELIDKFLNAHITAGGIGMNIKQAKQCALIAVDEILTTKPNNLKSVSNTFDDGVMVSFEWDVKYWNEVKSEIINYELQQQ